MRALKRLSPAHRPAFVRYLAQRSHELSACAFENIYLWNSFYEILWSVADGNLCVFFRDTHGCFLYLPPLGRSISLDAVDQAFRVMGRYNASPELSRIENVSELEGKLFERDPRYRLRVSGQEYVYRRRDIAELKGGRFKGKRWGANYFQKNYRCTYRPMLPADRAGVRELVLRWMRQRESSCGDSLYRGLLQDSRRALFWVLKHYTRASYQARVVTVGKEIKAFSLGYPLNGSTFCILFEVTDLEAKGAAQFIFREFCRELDGFEYINVMDDSGLENLRRVKLSYKPYGIPTVYNVRQAA